MKLNSVGSILIALVLLAVASPALAQVGAVDPPACAVMAWSPEMFSFYGDKQTVLAKFQALDRDLLKHRVYAFVVESKDGSSVTFFEQGDGDTMELSSMVGDTFRELSGTLERGLLENHGSKCAGMFSKDVVQAHAHGRLARTTVPRPANAGSAFEHALSLSTGSYVRATFFLFC